MAPEHPSHPFLPATTPQEGRLLVLGHQANVRTLVVTALSQAGYAVAGYATLAEVVLPLQEQAAPALIVLDGAAADEQALHDQLQQLVRLLPPAAPCPILLLSTAHPPPRVAHLPGAVTLLRQPFDLVELVHLVASLSAGPPASDLS